MTLCRLGSLAHGLNRPEEAYRLFREGLDLLRRTGDPSGIAYSLSSLGTVATTLGRHAEARNLLQESLALSREIGNQWEVGFSLTGLGLDAQAQADYVQAQALFEESIKAFREIGDQWNIARTLNFLGRTSHALGECSEAELNLHEALRIALNIQATTVIIQIALSWGALLADLPETRMLAAELLLALLQHPATAPAMLDRAESQLAKVEAYLPPRHLESLQVRPFNLIVEELLYRISY
jgi:tetratricopeptide (TPR) repeat protein